MTAPDCAGGMPCTTCPDKRQCGRTGCVRQPEYIGGAVHAAVPAYQPMPDGEADEALRAAGVRMQYMTHAVTRKELWTTAGSVDVMTIVRAIESAVLARVAAAPQPAGAQPEPERYPRTRQEHYAQVDRELRQMDEDNDISGLMGD